MLATIIYFNYFKANTFDLKMEHRNWLTGFTISYLLYLIPFLIAYLLQFFFYKNRAFFISKWFWVILIIAPAIFAFRVNFIFIHPVIQSVTSGDAQLFWVHCSKWFTGIFVVLIPVYVIWKIKDSKTQLFYGLQKMNGAKPYLVMVGCMVPFIALAATQADFLHMYPRAKIVSTWQLHPRYLYYILHEIFYSLDFITIEIFFRGFLILALASICGKQCIVPAACFYCCIHLGKPMAEAVSSFAGGLLLGIVSYNTKSIRGGLMVHLGIAWLMEIAGFIAMQS